MANEIKISPLGQSEDVEQHFKNLDRMHNILPMLRTMATYIDFGESVLDVGCFAGYALDWLEKEKVPFDRYKGIDIEDDHIALARYWHLDKQQLFHQRDLFEWVEKADHVFCSRVLIHLHNWEEALAHLWNITDKRLYVSLMVRDKATVEHHGGENGEFDLYHVTSNDVWKAVSKLDGVKGKSLSIAGKYQTLMIERKL